MVAHGELAETRSVPDRRVRRRQRAARARHPRRRDPRRRRPRSRTRRRRGGRSRRASRTASTRRRRRCATSSSALLGRATRSSPKATRADPRRRWRATSPTACRGLVLTNEVPDAFGVHKVVLTPDGEARVALVVPRVEAALRARPRRARSRGASPTPTRRCGGPSICARTPATSTWTAGTWAAVMEARRRAVRPRRARGCRARSGSRRRTCRRPPIPDAGRPPDRRTPTSTRRPSPPRIRASCLRERPRRPFHPRARVVAARRLRRHDRLRRHHLGPGPGRPARGAPVPRLRRPAGLRAAAQRSVLRARERRT